jgi:hypothetical protein
MSHQSHKVTKTHAATLTTTSAIQLARDEIAPIRVKGRWWVKGINGGMHRTEANRVCSRLRIQLALTMLDHGEEAIQRNLALYDKSGGMWSDYVWGRK